MIPIPSIYCLYVLGVKVSIVASDYYSKLSRLFAFSAANVACVNESLLTTIWHVITLCRLKKQSLVVSFTLWPSQGTYSQHFIFSVTYERAQYVRELIPGRLF